MYMYMYVAMYYDTEYLYCSCERPAEHIKYTYQHVCILQSMLHIPVCTFVHVHA